MKNIFIILLLFVIYGPVPAQQTQKQDYIVPMGLPAPGHPELGGDKQFQINFQTEPSTIDTGHYPFPFHITHASICDTAGNLMLYTNGVSIANGLHEFVEGGDTITLHNDQLEGFDGLEKQIPQGALLLPSPANNGIYYLFHEEHQLLHDPLTGFMRFMIPQIYLTTIDMNANGGKGKVLEKNVLIAERDSLFDKGRILAVRHANGRDWWVVIPEYYSTHLRRFLVTPEGVLPQPDIIIQEKMFPAGDPEQAAFSPDGTKYAITGFKPENYQRYFYLFDFDRCTGILHNQQTLQLDNWWLWGVFFSPDSRYMYWVHTDSADVTQFDLWDSNWYDSGETVYEWEGFAAPFPAGPIYGWHGPDGRIYLPSGNGVTAMHRINQPNRRGVACDFERNIPLPSVNYVTLPNFPNYRLGPIDGSSCDTLGINNDPVSWWRWEQDTLSISRVNFTDLSYHEPAEWLWDFGDGTAVSQDTSPVHGYSSAGVYDVCLTVTNVHGSSTYCKAVEVTGVSGDNDAPLPSSAIRLHPNPANDVLFVNGLTLPDGRHTLLSLTDINGRRVLQHSLTPGQTAIPINQLPDGVYFCSVVAQGQVVTVGRVVIIH